MIGRRQLPVSSTITTGSLVRAIPSALGGGARERALLGAELRRAFGAESVVLVDSGTSALSIALRATTRSGGVVALPAYACVDIAASAIFARLRVRLYDTDPLTLSPDLDSVARVLAQGVDTIVVAHLYGYPANVPAVTALAAAHGVRVVEDAAQGAWGKLLETRLGAFGPLSVLSFGRGKGMTGAGGGALLGIGAKETELIEEARSTLLSPRSGMRTLTLAKAQWILGRPALYALPSAIPGLHLGETIYHPAHEPRAITSVSASLVRSALARAETDLAVRHGNAEELSRAIDRVTGILAIRAIPGSKPGYLRLPVRVEDGRRERPELGIVHGYPETLAELAELQPSLISDEQLPGAKELRRSLVTLPTHGMLTEHDLQNLTDWMG